MGQLGTALYNRFPALRVREYRLFFIAQFTSLIGTWMQQTAIGWLVYDITKSAFYVGAATMALSLPLLFFTLIGGILADRLSKRNIMIATQALSILPALLLAMLITFNAVHVWYIIIIAAMLGTINAIDVPARQSFFVEVVGKVSLLNAVALNSMSFHSARIIGPLVAGIIIERIGMSGCFYINAISFVPVIIVLSIIKPAGAKVKQKGIVADLMEGFRYILDNGRMLYLFLTITLFSLLVIPFNSFLQVFADHVYHSGVRGYSVLMSFLGLGSLLGGTFVALRGDVERKTTLMSVTGLLYPLSLFMLCFAKSFNLACLILAVGGFNLICFLATTNTHLQLASSDEFRGRVMSVYALMFLGMTPFGAAMIGTLADAAGIRTAVAIFPLITLVCFIFLRNKWADKRQTKPAGP